MRKPCLAMLQVSAFCLVRKGIQLNVNQLHDHARKTYCDQCSEHAAEKD